MLRASRRFVLMIICVVTVSLMTSLTGRAATNMAVPKNLPPGNDPGGLQNGHDSGSRASG